MPCLLFIGQDAQYDIMEAWDFYEDKRPGLGDIFLNELDVILGQISERPLTFQLVYGQKRRAVLKRFKYNLFFVFENDEIDVLAVMHGSRSPERWKER